MKSWQIWTLSSIIVIALFVAVFLAIPAGIIYPEQKLAKTLFWSTTCNVTVCYALDPTFDNVTIASHEYFERELSFTLKHGCVIYPVGSLVVCWVNSQKLTIVKPGGHDGLVLVILSSLCALIGIVTIFVWFGCCIFSSCRAPNQAVAATAAPLPTTTHQHPPPPKLPTAKPVVIVPAPAFVVSDSSDITDQDSNFENAEQDAFGAGQGESKIH